MGLPDLHHAFDGTPLQGFGIVGSVVGTACRMTVPCVG